LKQLYLVELQAFKKIRGDRVILPLCFYIRNKKRKGK
jgi:hypothetical protein